MCQIIQAVYNLNIWCVNSTAGCADLGPIIAVGIVPHWKKGIRSRKIIPIILTTKQRKICHMTGGLRELKLKFFGDWLNNLVPNLKYRTILDS